MLRLPWSNLTACLYNPFEPMPWEAAVKLRIVAFLRMLIGGGVAGLVPVTLRAAEPAGRPKPEISEEARAVLQRMGDSLRMQQFAFQAQTIRLYAGPKGEPLDIFHPSMLRCAGRTGCWS